MCNFTVLLYSSFVASCYSHFLTLFTSVSLFLSLPFSLLTPLTLPHFPSYIIFALQPLGRTPSNPTPARPLSQSRFTTCREYGGGQASHGIIQLTYPGTGIHGVRVCVFSVCVANRNLCGFVDLVFKLLKQSLWLPERSGVIKLPLFQKLSCDCVMAPSFRLPSSSC